jgi:hypothetical protein
VITIWAMNDNCGSLCHPSSSYTCPWFLPELRRFVLNTNVRSTGRIDGTRNPGRPSKSDDSDTATVDHSSWARRMFDALDGEPPLTFLLAGQRADLKAWSRSVTRVYNTSDFVRRTTTYTEHSESLKLTVEATTWVAAHRLPAATEWLLWFENTGSTQNTKIISQVLPLDLEIPSTAGYNTTWPPPYPPAFTVLHAAGSNASQGVTDFEPRLSDMGPVAGCIRCPTGRPDASAGSLNFTNCSKAGHSSLILSPTTTDCCPWNASAGRVTMECDGLTAAAEDGTCPPGRSSDGTLPFFNVCIGNCTAANSGLVFGVGWTGQWVANLTKPANASVLTVTAGMNNTHFVLHPGERVRTPAILMMHYSGGWLRGQNAFRQLMARRYTPANAQNRSWSMASPGFGGGGILSPPFCYTEELTIKGARNIAATGTPFNAYWLDACWHEYENQTHDISQIWMPNPNQFPGLDGKGSMRPVADAAHEAGMDVMLWFEPERLPMNYVYRIVVEEHPDWALWPRAPDANLSLSTQCCVLINCAGPPIEPRFNALGVSHSQSILHGVFVWVRRVLNDPFR